MFDFRNKYIRAGEFKLINPTTAPLESQALDMNEKPANRETMINGSTKGSERNRLEKLKRWKETEFG